MLNRRIVYNFTTPLASLKTQKKRNYWVSPTNINFDILKDKYAIHPDIMDIIKINERNIYLLQTQEKQLKDISDQLTNNEKLLKNIYIKLETFLV